jgi:uncharacterized protein
MTMFFVAASALIGGCSPLAPRPSDPSKFYILTPLPIEPGSTSSAASANGGRRLTVGVGPIEFPEYLTRTELVTRTTPNRIDVSDQSQWAEPLDQNFVRVLSENLSALLHTQRIEQYPWPRKIPVDYQVAIKVRHFETTAASQAQLIAGWIIKDGRSGEDLYDSETVASAPVGPQDGGAPAALSIDLGQLSTEIATQVSALNEEHVGGSKEQNPRSSITAASLAGTASITEER